MSDITEASNALIKMQFEIRGLISEFEHNHPPLTVESIDLVRGNLLMTRVTKLLFVEIKTMLNTV